MHGYWLIQILKVTWKLRLLPSAVIARLVIELKVGIWAKIFWIEYRLVGCLKYWRLLLSLSISYRFHTMSSSCWPTCTLRQNRAAMPLNLSSHILTEWAQPRFTIRFKTDISLWCFWSNTLFIGPLIYCRWLRYLSPINDWIRAWQNLINLIVILLSLLSGTLLPSSALVNIEFLNWHGLYHPHIRVESAENTFVGASFIGNRKSNLDFEVSLSVASTNYSVRSIFLGLFPIVSVIHSLHQVFILAIHMRSCQWIQLLRIVTHCIMNFLWPTFPLQRVDSHRRGIKLPFSHYFPRDETRRATIQALLLWSQHYSFHYEYFNTDELFLSY